MNALSLQVRQLRVIAKHYAPDTGQKWFNTPDSTLQTLFKRHVLVALTVRRQLPTRFPRLYPYGVNHGEFTIYICLNSLSMYNMEMSHFGTHR